MKHFKIAVIAIGFTQDDAEAITHAGAKVLLVQCVHECSQHAFPNAHTVVFLRGGKIGRTELEQVISAIKNHITAPIVVACEPNPKQWVEAMEAGATNYVAYPLISEEISPLFKILVH